MLHGQCDAAARDYQALLFNIDLTDVFRTTQCLTVPKITQICPGIFKMWTVRPRLVALRLMVDGAACGVAYLAR